MAKKIGLTLGIVFVLVGVLGFISNPIVGTDAYFHTNTAHNVVHLATGIVFLLVAGSSALGGVLKLFGIVYLLVAVLGFLAAEGEKVLWFLDVNSADNWLHVVLGVVILGAGIMAGKSRPVMTEAPNPSMGGMGSTM